MKIYEIGTGYTPIPATMGAATEIVVEELTKAFMKMDVPVEIIDIKAKARKEHALPISEVWVPGCFAGTDVKLGVMHKLKRVVYSVCLAQKLKKILKNCEKNVILHFHNQYNMFFFLKLTPEKLREKAVLAYTNHSGIWRMPWEEIQETIKGRYFQEAECMKKADRVFVLNEETAENANKHLGIEKERFVLIDNGVNTDVYYPLTDKEKAKAQFSFSDRKVILQVGSVCENKGQLRALKLLAPLLQADKSLIYAYAGGIVSEEYRSEISSTAGRLGIDRQVRYLGMIKPGEELNALYNAANATVQASEYEGFPLVKIESLAAGVPVLLHENGPVLYAEGCVMYREDTFEENVRQLLAEGEAYRALCEKARESALRCFAWEKIANDYYDHFNQ